MENLFEENQEVGVESISSEYPEMQVIPAAAALPVLYGVIGGVISGMIMEGCRSRE